MTTTLDINRSQLIDALDHEYEFLCHDDFDPDVDPTPAEYRAMLASFTDDDLRDESSTDDTYTLDDYITNEERGEFFHRFQVTDGCDQIVPDRQLFQVANRYAS